MKIQTKLTEFKKLIEAGMIYKSKAYVSPINLEFAKSQLTAKGTYTDIMAVHIIAKKDFFDKYSAESETIPYTPDLLDKLSWKFDEEGFTVETKKDKIFLSSGKTKYDTDLEEPDEKPYPFKMAETEHGIIPEKIELNSAVLIDSKHLKLPQADSYFFEISKGKLKASIKGMGNWSDELKVEKFIGKDDILIAVDADFFNAIVNNIEDKVLFVFRENAIIIAEHSENLDKTYLLATQNIEE